jgi:hypothetical protein
VGPNLLVAKMSLRFFLWGIRFILPWLGRVIAFLLHLILITIVSLWVGVPSACRNVANDWRERARRTQMFSPAYLDALYNTICVVTFIVILFSWIVFAYITVFVVGLFI